MFGKFPAAPVVKLTAPEENVPPKVSFDEKPVAVSLSQGKKVFILYFAVDLEKDLKQAEELSTITNAIKNGKYGNLVELVSNQDKFYQTPHFTSQGQGSLDQLIKMVEHITIKRGEEGELALLHLSCRGIADKIQLAKEVSYYELTGRLQKLLSIAKRPRIPCTFLSICLSHTGAHIFESVSDFVIGAPRKIGANFTLDVTADFYKQFMAGKSLGDATHHINIRMVLGLVEEDVALTDAGGIEPFVAVDTRNPNSSSYSLKNIDQTPTLSTVLARLKSAQLQYIQFSKDHELYIPLHGVIGNYTTGSKRYKLCEEIVDPFLSNLKKKTLLVLGEAGTGKTKFAEALTKYLYEKKEIPNGKTIVPLYVRLADSKIKNLRESIVVDVLKTFGLSQEEVKLLLTSSEIEFFFIFDGMDELLRKDKTYGMFYHSNQIRYKFPTSHSVFTGRRSGLPADYEKFFEPQSRSGEEFAFSEQEKEVSLAPFDEETKEAYIGNFILKRGLTKAFGYTDAKTVYERIKSIAHLGEIVGRPILLMMTMHVLPYLEVFYRREQEFSPEEKIEKDLFHMYTHHVYTRAVTKILGRNSENARFNDDMDSILMKDGLYALTIKFSIDLAKLMNIDGHTVNEVVIDEVFADEYDAPDVVATTLTPKQIVWFKKYFCTNFEPGIYKNELEFRKYMYIRECCDLLQKKEVGGHISYGFLHDDFLDYFATLLPQCLNGQRKLIQDFMDGYQAALEQNDTPVKDGVQPSASPSVFFKRSSLERMPVTLGEGTKISRALGQTFSKNDE